MLEQLKARFNSLSAQHKALASVILANPHELVFTSVSTLARIANVSTATVVRFARELGYKGFRELRQQAAQESYQASTLGRFELVARRRQTQGSLLAEAANLDIASIRSTVADTDPRQFEAAVDRILGGATVYILGLRSSYPLAVDLNLRLRPLLSRVVLLDLGEGDLPDRIMNASQSDVLIAIAFSRYTKETVAAARWFAELGAGVVAITDSPVSPIARVATSFLCVRSDSLHFLHSLAPAFVTTGALAAAVGLKTRNETARQLQAWERFVGQHDIFWRGDY